MFSMFVSIFSIIILIFDKSVKRNKIREGSFSVHVTMFFIVDLICDKAVRSFMILFLHFISLKSLFNNLFQVMLYIKRFFLLLYAFIIFVLTFLILMK